MGGSKLRILFFPSCLGDGESFAPHFDKETALGEVIECRLQEYDLDNAREYISLSCTWGNPSVAVPILLNDQKHSVTQNLHYALPQASGIMTMIPLGVAPSGGFAAYTGKPWIVVVVPVGVPK